MSKPLPATIAIERGASELKQTELAIARLLFDSFADIYQQYDGLTEPERRACFDSPNVYARILRWMRARLDGRTEHP